MVSINFCPPAHHLLTSGIILNSKMFQQSMFSFSIRPTCLSFKMFYASHEVLFFFFFFFIFYKIIVSRLIYFMFSQGRLPYQVKSFVKYIRLNSPPPSLLNTCKKKLSITYVLFYFFQKTIYATRWS